VVTNSGKTYVESSIADEYAFPRISVMNVSYQVGQEYEAPGTDPDGQSKPKYTEEQVRQKMLEDAMKQFTENGVDGVNITLDVEFLLLGDTEEYKQYRGLQNVCLYDVIKVKTGKSQIDAEAQVTEYEYDCIRKRYNSVKLGKINSFNRRIPGYRITNNSITYDKLSPDLINRILTEDGSASTNSGSSGGSPAGDDGINPSKETHFVYDTIDSSSVSGGSNGSVTVSLPTGVTLLDSLIPVSAVPKTTWDTVAHITGSNASNRTISFHTVGSDSQKYTVHYIAAYST
jgi:hypothetical protein